MSCIDQIQPELEQMTVEDLAAWMRATKAGLLKLQDQMGQWHDEYEVLAEEYADLGLPTSDTQKPEGLQGLIDVAEESLALGRKILAAKIATKALLNVAKEAVRPAAA